MSRKVLFRWIKIIVLVYSVIGILFYYLQHKIFFHPESLPADYNYAFEWPHREVNIPWSATSNINIIQFSATKTDSARGVVLYFHGNRKNIGWYAKYAPYFTKSGYEVWMIDYPGYGKSTGEFTEQRLYDWALQLYKLARSRFQPNQIVIYGKSLGTGIATQLASIRDCRHLILETPYYDFPSIARTWLWMYPLQRMVYFKIPTHQHIQKVDAPITIFHGTRDGVISYRNGQRLQQYLGKNDQFVTIEGGSHNNLYDYPVLPQQLDSILSAR